MAHASGGPHFNPPKQYYIALGDSLAFGFQLGKFQAEETTGTYNPASFNSGYVDDFAQMLVAIRPDIQTVNYSCSGETTATFIAGGCPFHTASLPLHNDYPVTTSQLDEALAFLQAHPGQVSPITIDLGSNDLKEITAICQGSTQCIVTRLAAVGANFDRILAALKSASPSSEIIVLDSADPYQFIQPSSIPLFGALNAVLAGIATSHRAPLVDIFTPLLGYPQATFCTLSFVCTPPLHDVHPTDAGYSLIAQYVWSASGYGRLDD